MAPSGNFINWWNIVFPIKNVLFTLTLEVDIKSAYLKYYCSNSENSRNLSCTSLHGWGRHMRHVKRISKFFGLYLSHGPFSNVINTHGHQYKCLHHGNLFSFSCK